MRPGSWSALAVLAILAMAMGCSDGVVVRNVVPNQRPTVTITSSPIAQDPSEPAFYVTNIHWSADDPDGRVDGFEYAVDPGPADTVWVTTTRHDVTLFLSAMQPDAKASFVPKATDFHTFVIRAIDNGSARSALQSRSFYSYTIAPTVSITNPRPSHLLFASVGPSVVIEWTGTDADGVQHQRPVRYKYKLFDVADPETINWFVRPDSLRNREAPSRYAAWDSLGSDTTRIRFASLALGKSYLFVVVGLDEAGAYSPVFSLDENMLAFRIGSGNEFAPRIHVFNSYIDFTYSGGGYTTNPEREIRLEMPAQEAHEFRWDAVPSQGAFIERYRWVLDTPNISDNTSRTNEDLDWQLWSRASNATTSCRVGPLAPGDHYLYIEATDSNGLASLGIVRFTVVNPKFEGELLVVDDTRLEVDQRPAGGCLLPYTKPWPSATELDTFMFARGGVPWRCAVNPSTAVTPPGLFAGYAFDTLGTRLGLENPAGAAPLSLLGRYRNVVWMLDPEAAIRPDNVSTQTFTTLYAMSRPGSQSALVTYARMGGRVWLLGGGAAYATLIQFDKSRNNRPSTTFFSAREGELASPMLMHDGVHWQSAIAVLKSLAEVRRSPRAEQIALAPWTHPDVHAGGTLSAPDYARLPGVLRLKTPETDAIPPSRAANRGNLFYPGTMGLEVLSETNVIVEDVDLDPDATRLLSTLDTLYEASGAALPGQHLPIMTYYHGAQPRQMLFSGFSPWLFTRDDGQRLVDFVLQDIWGLAKAQAASRGQGSATRLPAPSAHSSRCASATDRPAAR